MSSENNLLVLISGESTTGKSASLRNIAKGDKERQKKWMYLNCEAGKKLPFKNNFSEYIITDPYQIYEALEEFANNDFYEGLIVDTLTFLMDMFETQFVVNSPNTMQGWANYQQFFKKLMQFYVPSTNKPIIILAHTRTDYDESKMDNMTSVPIKGALKNNGIEAYFTTVVSTKKMPIKDLKDYENDLLTITEDDVDLGYKHVFQTRVTKKTTNERIRNPFDLFTKKQTFIDNDVAVLLKHLEEYYE